jgi:anti-anti-sigma regulatory factor
VVNREEGCAVGLRGEFDLACHATLGSALDDALRRNAEVLVDLSGMTFLDGSCVRELALLLALRGERLVLEGSSREVEVGVTACGMEDLVWFGLPRRGTEVMIRCMAS